MTTTKEIISSKRFVVTGLIVLFSVLFLGFFTQTVKTDPVFQTILVSVAFFLVVPALYCKMVLKESVKSLGWQPGNFAWGILSSTFSVALALGVIYLLSRYTPFAEEYVFPRLVETNFLWFTVYELGLVTFTLLLYEVFFRGMVQMLWLRHFGFLAIIFQSALFALLLYLGGDISWQRVPVLLFSPLAGIIAALSGSIWYSWAAGWVFLFLTDIYLLVLH